MLSEKPFTYSVKGQPVRKQGFNRELLRAFRYNINLCYTVVIVFSFISYYFCLILKTVSCSAISWGTRELWFVILMYKLALKTIRFNENVLPNYITSISSNEAFKWSIFWKRKFLFSEFLCYSIWRQTLASRFRPTHWFSSTVQIISQNQ